MDNGQLPEVDAHDDYTAQDHLQEQYGLATLSPTYEQGELSEANQRLRSRSKGASQYHTTENTVVKRKIRVQRIVPNERVVAAVDKMKAKQAISQRKSHLS